MKYRKLYGGQHLIRMCCLYAIVAMVQQANTVERESVYDSSRLNVACLECGQDWKVIDG